MTDIVTERSGSILRVQFNRPSKKNAMTSAMYLTMADLLDAAAQDDRLRVVLWHGVGDSFCAGNDLDDFLKNPPGPEESAQSRLINAFIGFDKPIVVAVQGAAIGGGTTMLTHCDYVYAGETAKFQMPFINLALQACKRLMKQPWRQQLFETAKAENKEFSARVRSADTKEAITAFFEKRPPDFTKTAKVAVAQR